MTAPGRIQSRCRNKEGGRGTALRLLQPDRIGPLHCPGTEALPAMVRRPAGGPNGVYQAPCHPLPCSRGRAKTRLSQSRILARPRFMAKRRGRATRPKEGWSAWWHRSGPAASRPTSSTAALRDGRTNHPFRGEPPYGWPRDICEVTSICGRMRAGSGLSLTVRFSPVRSTCKEHLQGYWSHEFRAASLC